MYMLTEARFYRVERGFVAASVTVTDTYEPSLPRAERGDAFGRSVSSTGRTTNPYKYDAAWG